MQTLVDPINMAEKLAANTTKLHVIEIVGDEVDGGVNLSDQVLPNGNGVTLTGTETLINLLNIGCLDSTTPAETAGVVRFTKGHHISLINPASAAGATTLEAYASTVEMQTQVVTFAEGASLGNGNILIQDDTVIKSCP